MKAKVAIIGALLLWLDFGGLSTLAGGTGRAQVEPDLTALSLEELAAVKVASVYGASKHEQRITEAPSSVTIVTADEIQKSGFRSLEEVLNSVRGFYTTWDRSYPGIGLRGFSQPGDYGSRILISLDGHRLNNPVYDSGGLIDVDLIDRVEVIRGPGSSLHGNNAFLAVINIITRRGSEVRGTELSGSYGSYDTGTGRITYGNLFTNGVEFVLSGSYFDSAGHATLFYPEFADANQGVARDLDQSQFGQAFASLSYRDLTFEGSFASRSKDLPTAPYSAVFNDSRTDVFDESGFAELRYRHEFGGEKEIMVRGYYDHYRYVGHTPLPEFQYGEPFYPGRIILNKDVSNSESAGAELQLSQVFFSQHRVTAGTEYRHDFTLALRNFDESPWASYVDANLTADTIGAYVQDEYAILEQLILNAGVRYDYFSSFGDTINPRAALIYSPWSGSAFKGMYGQAYRAPNAFELHYEAPGYSANSKLAPETIRSYELSYEQVINRHLQVTSTAFYSEIDDLITFQAAGDELLFGNLAGANSKGTELELAASWGNGWRGRAGYTYADARDSATDQRLLNSPLHLAKLNLTVPCWREKLFLNFEVLGISRLGTVQGSSTPGHWVANATLLSREIVKGLEVSASVYNLLDERYQNPVGPDFRQDAIEQDGRTFRVKLTCRF